MERSVGGAGAEGGGVQHPCGVPVTQPHSPEVHLSHDSHPPVAPGAPYRIHTSRPHPSCCPCVHRHRQVARLPCLRLPPSSACPPRLCLPPPSSSRHRTAGNRSIYRHCRGQRADRVRPHPPALALAVAAEWTPPRPCGLRRRAVLLLFAVAPLTRGRCARRAPPTALRSCLARGSAG